MIARPWMSSIYSGLIAAAFFARFYLPTEAAAQGETLWIVGIWLVIALLSLITQARGRLDRFDGAILVLVGAQVASALMIVATSGDKRAAINLAWEWIGGGIVWFVMRSRGQSILYRRTILTAAIAVGATLSLYGLWQHFVWQPQVAQRYGRLFDRYRTASGSELVTIQRELAAAGIPIEDPALTLYEKRLRDSREPLGCFALANSFGGLLAVCWILTAGSILLQWKDGSRGMVFVASLAFAGVIAWCLLLTKSRTAWLGAMAGSSLLVLETISFSETTKRRLMLAAGMASGLLALLMSIVFFVGGLDQQVLSEAPKSLAYRLQYWQATSKIIASNAWLGVGPGNFRQEYLVHKLPEASEEISDPHNLFFDVTSTGGIAAFVGLLSLLVLPALRYVRAAVAATVDHKDQRDSPQDNAAPSRLTLATLGATGATAAFLVPFLLRGEWDELGDHRLILAIAVAVLAAILGVSTRQLHVAGRSRPVRQEGKSSTLTRWVSFETVAFAGVVALAVHLLGAGGIAMPAIMQLLFVLVAWSLPPASPSLHEQPLPPNRWVLRAVLPVTMLAGIIVFAMTSIVPVELAQSQMKRSDQIALSGRADPASIDRSYKIACDTDPFWADPWRRRADVAYQQAAAESFRSNESFELAVKCLEESIARDPKNVIGPRTRGNWYLSRWKVTNLPEDARRAVESLQEASSRYPTNSILLTELADAALASQNHTVAQDTAKRALTQDDLNRTCGHVDRYLPQQVIDRMKRIVTTPIVDPNTKLLDHNPTPAPAR